MTCKGMGGICEPCHLWSWGCCERLSWVQNQMNTTDMSWNIIEPVTKWTASHGSSLGQLLLSSCKSLHSTLLTWKSQEELERCRNGIKVKVTPKPTTRKCSIVFYSCLNGFLWSLHSFLKFTSTESSPPPFLAQRLWQHHRTRSLPWPSHNRVWTNQTPPNLSEESILLQSVIHVCVYVWFLPISISIFSLKGWLCQLFMIHTLHQSSWPTCRSPWQL